MLGPETPAAVTEPTTAVALDPISLILKASGPVFVVVWLLIIAAVAVWVIAVLKLLQHRRWRSAELLFETEAARTVGRDELFRLARRHPEAPGGRIVTAIAERFAEPHVLGAVAKRALVAEQSRASALMSVLASIGSASPFVGLFGTVYGILDAFLRIGREKSASLPVVAPAIGEALIATAIGLFAAIPAVVAYNFIAKRLDDLLSGVEASAEGWVAMAGGGRLGESSLAQQAASLEKLAAASAGIERAAGATRVAGSDPGLAEADTRRPRSGPPTAYDEPPSNAAPVELKRAGSSSRPAPASLPPPEPMATRREPTLPSAQPSAPAPAMGSPVPGWPSPDPYAGRTGTRVGLAPTGPASPSAATQPRSAPPPLPTPPGAGGVVRPGVAPWPRR